MSLSSPKGRSPGASVLASTSPAAAFQYSRRASTSARPASAVSSASSRAAGVLRVPPRASMDQRPSMANPLKPAMRVNYSVDDIRITGPNVDLDSMPDYLKKDCILFYCKEAAPLARKVAALSDKVQLGEVNWKCVPAWQPPVASSPAGLGREVVVFGRGGG